MILGIGNDVIEIKRVGKACEKEAFVSRYYTDDEISVCAGKASRLAGNFAVKEAVAKSFGTGFRGFEAKDVEVLRDELGKPYVNLYGGAKKMYESMSATALYVTISNTKEYASAVAILER